MRLSINDDCKFQTKAEAATGALLGRLKEHHDYAVPYFITKHEVTEIRAVEIKTEPEISQPIEVCILPIPVGKLTVDAIKRVVCRHFGISHNEMISPRRDKKVQRPRMVAMYLAKTLTPHSLPELGRRFGYRDHSTILNSVRRAAQFIAEEHPISRDIQYLNEVLST